MNVIARHCGSRAQIAEHSAAEATRASRWSDHQRGW